MTFALPGVQSRYLYGKIYLIEKKQTRKTQNIIKYNADIKCIFSIHPLSFEMAAQ
jgi:hypothetical protein